MTRNAQIRRVWRSSRPLFYFATFTSALGVGIHFLAKHEPTARVKSTQTQTLLQPKAASLLPAPVTKAVEPEKPLVVDLPKLTRPLRETKPIQKKVAKARPPRKPRLPKKVAVAATAVALSTPTEASTLPTPAITAEPVAVADIDLEEAVEATAEQAVDTDAPLDRLVAEVFAASEAETSGLDINALDPRAALAATEAGAPHPLAVNPYQEKVGLFRKTEFTELHRSLDLVTRKVSELEWVPFRYEAPKELAAPRSEEADKMSAPQSLAALGSSKVQPPKSEPELVRPKATAASPPDIPKLTAAAAAAGTVAPSLSPTPVRMAKRESAPVDTVDDAAEVRAESPVTQREWSEDEYAATTQVVDARPEPTLAAPTRAKPTQTNVLVAAAVKPTGPAVIAAPAPTLVRSAPVAPPTLVVPEAKAQPELVKPPLMASATKAVAQSTPRVAMRFQRAPVADESASEAPQSPRLVVGHLVIDRRLREEIDSRKGHIELQLHPETSRDPLDSIRLDEYQYPDEDFEVDVRELKGTYRLIALIFMPGTGSAVARLVCKMPVSVERYKETIFFPLKWDDYIADRKQPAPANSSVGFTMSIFKWMSGNSDTKVPMPTAQARILGMPEYGLLRADAHGDIRIPKVPAASELLLEVSAPGFYPTYQVVPTFRTHVYHTAYLVEKDLVGFVVSSFLKSTLKLGMGTLLGRTFDPQSKQPLAGEQVSMWFRKGKALYFDTMPDTQFHATTKTGLFGFFNVMPAFRFLSRGEAKPAYMVNVRPDSATYVELGRGGKKSLRGRVHDPFAGTAPAAKVKLLGSPHFEVETDRDGRFEIPDIDFPPGQVTVEVEAPGYRSSLYSIPWSPREPEKEHDLFVLERELILSSAAHMGRTKLQRDKGTLVGGADPSLIAGKTGCVQVVLETMDGTRVDSEKGPFPLLGGVTLDFVRKGEPMCLTPGRQGFVFFNLDPGTNYILKWVSGSGRVFRSRVVQIGVDRDTIAIN